MKESFDENGNPCYKGEDGLPIVYINKDNVIIKLSTQKQAVLMVDKKILKQWIDNLALNSIDFTQEVLWFAELTHTQFNWRWEHD